MSRKPLAPWRGKGAGRWFLARAGDHARRLGCHDLTVSLALSEKCDALLATPNFVSD